MRQRRATWREDLEEAHRIEAAEEGIAYEVSLATRAGAAVDDVSAGFIIAVLAVARDPSPRAVPAAENTQPDALSVPLAAPLPVAGVGGAQLPKGVSEKDSSCTSSRRMAP